MDDEEEYQLIPREKGEPSATEKQKKYIMSLCPWFDDEIIEHLGKDQASNLIDQILDYQRSLYISFYEFKIPCRDDKEPKITKKQLNRILALCPHLPSKEVKKLGKNQSTKLLDAIFKDFNNRQGFHLSEPVPDDIKSQKLTITKLVNYHDGFERKYLKTLTESQVEYLYEQAREWKKNWRQRNISYRDWAEDRSNALKQQIKAVKVFDPKYDTKFLASLGKYQIEDLISDLVREIESLNDIPRAKQKRLDQYYEIEKTYDAGNSYTINLNTRSTVSVLGRIWSIIKAIVFLFLILVFLAVWHQCTTS